MDRMRIAVALSCAAPKGRAGRMVLLAAPLLAALVLLVLLPAGPVLAASEYVNLRGVDRYDTAIRVSQAGFPPGVEGLVLAVGDDFPDALSAGPLAAAYGGPVLLTHRDALDDTTRAEIARLAPHTVFLVGLESPIIDAVTAAFPDLAAQPDGLVRLVGVNRYDTARLVAEQLRQRVGAVSGAVLVPGDSFADALSVGPLAAARAWPILLTPADGPLPGATAQALAELQPGSLLEVGTMVDPGMPGTTVQRLAGGDRYATCALVAAYAADQGLPYTRLSFATGEDFPDGLAAGPYLAVTGGALLLTGGSGAPPAIAAVLLQHAQEVERATFIGLGSAAVAQVKLLLSASDVPPGVGFSTLSQGDSGAEVLWLEERLTELSYRPGPIDGVFDKCTYQAVLAFEKWERLGRDGVVGPRVWTRLLGAGRPAPSHGGGGTWLEVDKDRQVLLYVEGGVVERTLAVATGNPSVGITTPSGTFHITARSGGWDGPRYKPLYLTTYGVLAIHGYPSVPAWPASHGCIRVPLWDQDELFPLIPVGTPVYIH